MGRTSKLRYSIDTGNALPVWQPVRWIPSVKRGEISQLLEDMVEQDIIQPSLSPWASPVVLVQKGLASVWTTQIETRKDANPLLRIDDTRVTWIILVRHFGFG